MKNILTFEDYKNLNIRQVESVIYRQFIEDDIKDESNEVSEGFIRKSINKAASKFIKSALADEIEKGKELEKSIKDALDSLDKGFEEIKKKIDSKSDSKSKLAAVEKVKEAIKSAQSQAFDTLTMIGSEGEIDFAGFIGSASVAAAANFGILFSPIRSLFITRKAYKYFLGIIKQTIRRNLLVIQLNFDQFENLILQKSFESEEDSEFMTRIGTLNDVMRSLTLQLCDGKNQFLKGSKNKELKDKFEIIKRTTEQEYRQQKASLQSNPLRSLWQDQYNNTYTKTLEQLKQYINDDSQKELEALKNSITKMAGSDVELAPYGELMISAAEEYAIHTNHGINNNFIKMSSAFNLENQKKLIDLIQETQKENQKEIDRRKSQKDKIAENKKLKKAIKDGKKLYEEKLKDSTEKFTFDKFNDTFDDNDIVCLRAFFKSDEGKDHYKELIEKNPLYKYLISDNMELTNTFLSSINNLEIVEISDIDGFSQKIVDKEHALYYLMAEKSIRDAVRFHKSDSEEYFGLNIGDDYIDGHILKDDIIKTKFHNILNRAIFGKKKEKKKYFLTFSGSGNGLFDMLHKEFKTKIFKGKGKYVSDISAEDKENIFKIIHKYFKIGNSISPQFAEYLVRLEAHMLLENKDDWFVVKNNDELKECFKSNSKKILNKNAFVEIDQDDYVEIKSFLKEYSKLYDNDFIIDSNEKIQTKKE